MITKLKIIKEKREIFLKNNTQEFQNKKQRFIDYLMQKEPLIKFLEMYPKNIYGKKQFGQYFNEYKFANTRTKLKNETRAEIDKLDFDKSMKIICEICLNLIKKEYHFAVFYAEGQRSPHIIIYDFEELEELKPYQRFKAQLKFWRCIFPFGLFQYMDIGINEDDHYVPIEFAPHWKYGTIFNLIFEYIPKKKKRSEVENANITD